MSGLLDVGIVVYLIGYTVVNLMMLRRAGDNYSFWRGYTEFPSIFFWWLPVIALVAGLLGR